MIRPISVITVVVVLVTLLPRPGLSSTATITGGGVAGSFEIEPYGRANWEVTSEVVAGDHSHIAMSLPASAGGDDDDCTRWADFINDFNEATEGLQGQRETAEEAVEKATKGAVKKIDSQAFKQYFKRYWQRILRKAAERGIGRAIIERYGWGAMFGAILLFHDVVDGAGEAMLTQDLMDHGVPFDEAQQTAEALSDMFLHMAIDLQPDLNRIGGLFLHFRELLLEGRPCLYTRPRKPEPPPSRQGRGGPRGGGVGPRGGDGTTVTTTEQFCWEITLDSNGNPTVIPKKC